jgi:hypothetical protein
MGVIDSYIFDAEWNYFTLPKLREIYDKFSVHLLRKSDGEPSLFPLQLTRRDYTRCPCPFMLSGTMNRTEFHRMHKRIGIDDEQIIDALFRYWDQNTGTVYLLPLFPTSLPSE